jgi:hypothetical protein
VSRACRGVSLLLLLTSCSCATHTPCRCWRRHTPHAPLPNAHTARATATLAPSTRRIFGSLEQVLARSFGGNRPGQRDDWQEVEGNWVLRPPQGVRTEAAVHFLGGAFVGAAPQLTYRLLLESLASRGVMVRAVLRGADVGGWVEEWAHVGPLSPAAAAAAHHPLSTPPHASCNGRSSQRPMAPALTSCVPLTRCSTSLTVPVARFQTS